ALVWREAFSFLRERASLESKIEARSPTGGARMSFVLGLKCRECGRLYEPKLLSGCEDCFAPLEVEYDYSSITKKLTRSLIESREKNLWRYRELLPINGDPTVGKATGATPLIKAERLGRALGLTKLFVKNDGVNCPTLSFKDRVTAVAVTKALEFGLKAVGCASTGNLANAVAAAAAAANIAAFVLIPEDLEQAKITASAIYGARVIAIKGNYDDVNRLSSQLADRHPWGFVNVNLRPFYGEGSKTFGYEIA